MGFCHCMAKMKTSMLFPKEFHRNVLKHRREHIGGMRSLVNIVRPTQQVLFPENSYKNPVIKWVIFSQPRSNCGTCMLAAIACYIQRRREKTEIEQELSCGHSVNPRWFHGTAGAAWAWPGRSAWSSAIASPSVNLYFQTWDPEPNQKRGGGAFWLLFYVLLHFSWF